MRDGALILNAPMAEIGRRYRQVVVDPAQAEAALALGPVFDETHFGRRVMLFDNPNPNRLEPLGQVGTPTLSDLFVALMQRPADAAAGATA
jgi:ABC-2 type transport system ATP-binding protein